MDDWFLEETVATEPQDEVLITKDENVFARGYFCPLPPVERQMDGLREKAVKSAVRVAHLLLATWCGSGDGASALVPSPPF